MASTYMTPGVYIQEINAFPNSATAVETSVPVFIGYTAKAEHNGVSLHNKPTRITSFAEYLERFGEGFKPKFTVDGTSKAIKIKENNIAYFYNAIRLFYSNGGATCYILSVGTYGDKPDGFEIKLDDFIDTADKQGPLTLLKKESEPTLVLVPDAIVLGKVCYNSVYTAVLQHCAEVQSRFGIFDLAKQEANEGSDEVVQTFRDEIGIDNLEWGAAYYPWLNTSVITEDKIDFRNIDADLEMLLPEPAAQQQVKNFKTITNADDKAKESYHQSLLQLSASYANIISKIRYYLNQLPPSGAMAGIYTSVDTNRGVWKAPANVSVNLVNSPSINISNVEQEKLNIDVMAGKSINVIRSFPGVGTLVWGGRTLDGNSQDWRYINVKRTLIMIEQSLKLAARSFVFEPNDANTWVSIKSMFNNFLTNLWKQGALAGATPEQAFKAEVGLGSTMTGTDILDGMIRVTVMVAVVRPAEFILITFEQQQQKP